MDPKQVNCDYPAIFAEEYSSPIKTNNNLPQLDKENYVLRRKRSCPQAEQTGLRVKGFTKIKARKQIRLELELKQATEKNDIKEDARQEEKEEQELLPLFDALTRNSTNKIYVSKCKKPVASRGAVNKPSKAATQIATSDLHKSVKRPVIASMEDSDDVFDGSKNNPNFIFSSQYIQDILLHEIQKEKKHLVSDEYCQRPNSQVTDVRRYVIVQWIVDIQLYLKIWGDILHLSVELLDVYMDRVELSFEDMQKAAAISFWVCYKFLNRGNLMLDDLRALFIEATSKEELLRLERKFLNVINHNVDICHPGLYLSYFFYLMYEDKFPLEIHHCALYLLDLMLIFYQFIHYSCHLKAATSLITAFVLFGADLSKYNSIREKSVIFYELHQLNEPHAAVINCLMQQEIPENAVYRKYTSRKYSKISQHDVFLNIKSFVLSDLS